MSVHCVRCERSERRSERRATCGEGPSLVTVRLSCVQSPRVQNAHHAEKYKNLTFVEKSKIKNILCKVYLMHYSTHDTRHTQPTQDDTTRQQINVSSYSTHTVRYADIFSAEGVHRSKSFEVKHLTYSYATLLFAHRTLSLFPYYPISVILFYRYIVRFFNH